MKVNPIFTRSFCPWSLFESEDFLDLENIIAYSHNIRHANSFLCGLFGTNFRKFSFRFRQGPIFFQYSCATCKRRQQLPTLLAQQCWALLRPCWQWCTNKRNDSEQCWDLQCIVGRIQLIRLWKLEFGSHIGACMAPTMLEELCKRLQHCCALLHFIDHGTKGMLEVVGQHCCVRLHEALHPRSLAHHRLLLFDNP